MNLFEIIATLTKEEKLVLTNTLTFSIQKSAHTGTREIWESLVNKGLASRMDKGSWWYFISSDLGNRVVMQMPP